jgi:hypothetical protein
MSDVDHDDRALNRTMPGKQEVDPLGPAPRRVRPDMENSAILWVFGIFLIVFLTPFVGVGIGAAIQAWQATRVHYYGTETTGRVLIKSTRYDSKNVDSYRGLVYTVTYFYTVDGKTYSGKTHVDPDTYASLQIESSVPVLYLSATPDSHAVIRGMEVGDLKFICLWAIFWNGALFGMMGLCIRNVRRARYLVSHGTAVMGTIMDKTEDGVSANATRWLHYEFKPVEAGPRASDVVRGKKSIRRGDWQSAVVGQRMIVLYLPGRPAINVLYEYSPFTVVD